MRVSPNMTDPPLIPRAATIPVDTFMVQWARTNLNIIVSAPWHRENILSMPQGR
jgi:hypothetical protein